MVERLELASWTAGVALTGLLASSISAKVTLQLPPVVAAVSSETPGEADSIAHTPSIMPTVGWLTSQFSLHRFHPVLHKYLPHLGIDIAAPYGATIVAPAAGTVIRMARAEGYGRVIEIDHGNGIVTKYGHLSHFLVHVDQQVVRGEPIARVGNSGLTTGPHLHYEVHVNGQIVDPLSYLVDARTNMNVGSCPCGGS
jgi:murein DD-endopeptidase MepM/ murein hydrolase activator NlpD